MSVRSEEFAKGCLPTPAEFVKQWPTPQAHKTTPSGEIVNADGTKWDGKSKPHSKTTGRPITTALADAVWMWPTPSAQQQQGGVQGLVGGSGHREKMKKAGHHEMLTGSLNPNWVEWLMGWPVGWTDLKPLETDRFQQWRNSHGKY